jgi:hypothetical protein
LAKQEYFSDEIQENLLNFGGILDEIPATSGKVSPTLGKSLRNFG